MCMSVLQSDCSLLQEEAQTWNMGFVFLLFLLFSRKEMIAQQREYKKKKALKKAQRIKELEQEREDQKVKWQQFNNRAYSKNKKGQVCLLLSVCE